MAEQRSEAAPLICRSSCARTPTKLELKIESTPNDWVASSNEFRTIHLKQPTVDLMYEDGKTHAIDGGVMVPVATGSTNMEKGVVYEVDLEKDPVTSDIIGMRPRPRVA